MKTNCPNCGAPVDIHSAACPYCKTPYCIIGVDLSDAEDMTVLYADNAPIAVAAWKEREQPSIEAVTTTFGSSALTANECRCLCGLDRIIKIKKPV